MKIALASDHAGYTLKESIKGFIQARGHEYVDFGTGGEESVDYTDFGFPAAEAVTKGECDRGILVCGSGIGMSMLANKVPGIRAALCTSVEMAEMSRSHNDANVLILGERIIDPAAALEIVKTWVDTTFEGGRHQRRIDKIMAYESQPLGPGSQPSERSVIC